MDVSHTLQTYCRLLMELELILTELRPFKLSIIGSFLCDRVGFTYSF